MSGKTVMKFSIETFGLCEQFGNVNSILAILLDIIPTYIMTIIA